MSSPQESALPTRTIFVGLDCATHWIVEKMVNDGELPHLSKLMREGVTFHTETDEPVVSPVVWSSIASGKVPDKHGIKSFHGTSASMRTKRIWDIFEEHGHAVGVMGHFVTWPPRAINGFMIPDLLALDAQTYPREYNFIRHLTESSKAGKRQGLVEMIGFAVTAWRSGIRAATLLQAAGELVKRKIGTRDFRDVQYDVRVLKQRLYSDLFVALCKKFQTTYAYFHNHLIDTSSHIFWQYMEPEKFDGVLPQDVARFGGRLLEAYREADRTLGKILQLADNHTLVVAASDHGAKAAVNQALEWRIPAINTERLMQKLGIEKDVSYSNVGFDIMVKPRVEAAGSKEKLKDLFLSINLEEDSVPLFSILEHDTSNLWLRLNNRISETTGRHLKLRNTLYALDEFVLTSGHRTSGIHDGKNAILVMKGPGLKQGVRFKEKVQVLDIIPTILALNNMPVGRDMDGRVLREAITEEFHVVHPVQYIASYDDPETGKDAEADMESSEELKSQLRALGYL
jgi:arylsulfatase A-like enzyme